MLWRLFVSNSTFLGVKVVILEYVLRRCLCLELVRLSFISVWLVNHILFQNLLIVVETKTLDKTRGRKLLIVDWILICYLFVAPPSDFLIHYWRTLEYCYSVPRTRWNRNMEQRKTTNIRDGTGWHANILYSRTTTGPNAALLLPGELVAMMVAVGL